MSLLFLLMAVSPFAFADGLKINGEVRSLTGIDGDRNQISYYVKNNGSVERTEILADNTRSLTNITVVSSSNKKSKIEMYGVQKEISQTVNFSNGEKLITVGEVIGMPPEERLQSNLYLIKTNDEVVYMKMHTGDSPSMRMSVE